MAINLNQEHAHVIADNKVSFCGLEYLLTDAEARKLDGIIRGIISARSGDTPKPLVYDEDTATTDAVAIVGKVLWQEDFCTVTNADKQYRLYITCPVKGEKGKKIRYAIKASAKECGAKWAGNYDAHEIFWAFPSKAKADEYIKARKAKAAEKKGE